MGCGKHLFDGHYIYDKINSHINSWDDVSNYMSFGADPIGGSLGLKGWGDVVSGQFWRLKHDVSSDWRVFKHLMVPDLRRDREQMVNSPQSSRRIIYGRCRLSGQLVYAETAGSKNEFLHIVVSLGNHMSDSLESLYLDDRPISEFGDKATYEFFDGTQTEACASLVAASAGTWTAEHKLLGLTYLYLRLTYDEGLFPGGIPIPKAVVKGKSDLYDPRDSTYKWSDNPILAIRDYMVLPAELGGMGCYEGDDDRARRLAFYDANNPSMAALYRRIWGIT